MYKNFKIALTIPSIYGFFSWLIILFLMNLGYVEIYPLSLLGVTFISYTLIAFLAVTLISFNLAKRTAEYDYEVKPLRYDVPLFYIFTVVGIAGLFKYILDFSVLFGGFSALQNIFLTSSLDIRAMQTENTSIGVYISYFSWISIFFGVMIIRIDRLRLRVKLCYFAVIIFEVFLNLTFIDRTRPMFIIVTCLFGWYFGRGPRNLRLFGLFLLTLVLPITIFILFSLLSGKILDSYGVVGTLVYYVIGGFGYLDSLLQDDMAFEFVPVRSAYPFFKLLEALGLYGSVPSQIIEYRAVPFPTNVGTFVEPLYSDGGILFVLVGVPLVLFYSNLLALKGLRDRTYIGLFIWANFVYSSLISFFVPKFNTTPIYLFCTIWILMRIFSHKNARTNSIQHFRVSKSA